VRAELLDEKQPDENRHRDWDDVGAEERRHDLKSFNGTEYRDRRRNHAVAVQQRGAENPERDQQGPADRKPRTAARAAVPAWHQRGQSQNATLSLVVRAHDDGDVLD
jgi:hypothetical protein